MTLQETIKNDMKEAMKQKDAERVTVLRGLMSSFTNELVAQKKMPQDMLDDEAALGVITREAKRRKDSIAQFTEAGRTDLAEAEQSELAILEHYLPEMMSEEEIKKVVLEKKESLDITDKSQVGQLIGALMSELKGRADGALVKKVVEASL